MIRSELPDFGVALLAVRRVTDVTVIFHTERLEFRFCDVGIREKAEADEEQKIKGFHFRSELKICLPFLISPLEQITFTS